MGNICNKKKKHTDTEKLLWSFNDECCICMENPIQTAILDCGHLNCCLSCAKKLSNSPNENLRLCPICRREFKGYVTFSPNMLYFNNN